MHRDRPLVALVNLQAVYIAYLWDIVPDYNPWVRVLDHKLIERVEALNWLRPSQVPIHYQEWDEGDLRMHKIGFKFYTEAQQNAYEEVAADAGLLPQKKVSDPPSRDYSLAHLV